MKMLRRSISLMALLLGLLLPLTSCTMYRSELSQTTAQSTAQPTEKSDSGLIEDWYRYAIVLPEELGTSEYKQGDAYVDPEALTLFESEWLELYLRDLSLSDGSLRPWTPFHYRFYHPESDVVFTMTVTPTAYTDDNVVPWSFSDYTDLEQALENEEFRKQCATGFADVKITAGSGLERIIKVGNAYYEFATGFGSVGCIHFYVNDTWVTLELRWPDPASCSKQSRELFPEQITARPNYINHPVFEKLMHFTTAPEQIDQIIAAWEGKW